MPKSPFQTRLTYTTRWRNRRQKRLKALWQAPNRNWLDLIFAGLDYLGATDLYEATITYFAPSLRPLSTRELALLKPYFGNSVPYDLIRIDERAHIGPRTGRFCYVSFHTINSWGRMSDATLVHEVVHIWQYTHRGAAYVPRALRAQRSEMKYNYGGLAALDESYELEDFNYEQQADIIEDAFRLANGYQAQWVPGRGAEVLPYYQSYLAELRAATYRPW